MRGWLFWWRSWSLPYFYWLWFHKQTAALLFWVFTPGVVKCHALERLPACAIVATPVGTCEQQIKPGDAQRDKSCAGKRILSVTYSNKQIHTRSFLSFICRFFTYPSFDWHNSHFQNVLPPHFPAPTPGGNGTARHHQALYQKRSAGADLMAFVND